MLWHILVEYAHQWGVEEVRLKALLSLSHFLRARLLTQVNLDVDVVFGGCDSLGFRSGHFYCVGIKISLKPW